MEGEVNLAQNAEGQFSSTAFLAFAETWIGPLNEEEGQERGLDFSFPCSPLPPASKLEQFFLLKERFLYKITSPSGNDNVLSIRRYGSSEI